MKRDKFDNIWFAIEANEADAVYMTMRSDLMTSIEKAVGNWKLSQGEAAKRLGITPFSSSFSPRRRRPASRFP
jgi:predicted XRE-type DNA-binding protein